MVEICNCNLFRMIFIFVTHYGSVQNWFRKKTNGFVLIDSTIDVQCVLCNNEWSHSRNERIKREKKKKVGEKPTTVLSKVGIKDRALGHGTKGGWW